MDDIFLSQEDLTLLILAVKAQDKNDYRYRALLEKLYDIAELEEVEDTL